jgi:hypothetical protein
MSKRLEAQLAKAKALRYEDNTEENLEQLRGFLKKGEGLVVTEAANIVAEWYAVDLSVDLLAAFDRLSHDGPEVDPQCYGKQAVLKALRQLGWGQPEIFMRACKLIQLEPVWGGKEDSAAPLRANAAHALTECTRASKEQVLGTLIDMLSDAAWTVRLEALRAIANSGYTEAPWLLRLKLRTGDAEPRVIGACFDGLLSLEGVDAIALVAEYLKPPVSELRLPSRDLNPQNPLLSEAVASLAASNIPQAVEKAIAEWEAVKATPVAKVLLGSLAASPRPEGLEFLLTLLRSAPKPLAQQVLKALKPMMTRGDVSRAVLQELDKRGDGVRLEG